MQIGKSAGAITVILALAATTWQAMKFLGVDPVLSMELRAVQRQNLSRSIPLLKQQYRELRITRGQLKALPQTNDTIEDIEAYSDQIETYRDLLESAKKRAKELAE